MKENKTIKLVSEEEMTIGNKSDSTGIKIIPEEEMNKRVYPKEEKIKEIELRLKHGLSELTAKHYNFYITKFEEWNAEQTKEFQSQSIEERARKFIAYKMSEGLTNGSLFFIRSALESKFGDLNIKIPKPEKKLPTILTKEEIRTLINNTRNRKHKLLIKVLYSTGARLSEIINLKYSDIDFNENIIWIRQGKGKKDRLVGLSEDLKKELLERMKGYINSDLYIFSNGLDKMSKRAIQWAIGKAVENAKIEKDVHVHTFRHTYATHLLEDGVDIRKIQHLLGHTNLNTTQIYTQVSKDEIQKIKNPLDQLK